MSRNFELWCGSQQPPVRASGTKTPIGGISSQSSGIITLKVALEEEEEKGKIIAS